MCSATDQARAVNRHGGGRAGDEDGVPVSISRGVAVENGLDERQSGSAIHIDATALYAKVCNRSVV